MSAHVEAIRVSVPRAPLYAYWHLLSLDAPTVAFVWCVAFAASAGVSLPLFIPAALAVATWILYVADRLLDARRGGQGERAANLRERHWFHARHRSFLVAGLGGGAVFLIWIVARELPRAMLQREAILGAVVLFYFAAIHLPIRRLAVLLRIPLKEAIVGIIFAIAVAIPAWTLAPRQVFASIAGFALLCGLNCLVIETVERLQKDSGASIAVCEGLLLALSAATAALAAFNWFARERPLLICITISALLLFLLCRLRARFVPIAFRVAADAALLTPVLLAPWLWTHR
jgi:hypothetical protein